MNKVGEKVSDKMNKVEKLNIDRLRDFIYRRKSSILKEIPSTLSFKVLVERLRLEMSEIKKLYDFKMRTIKNDEKYLKIAKSILIYELNHIQNDVISLKVTILS